MEESIHQTNKEINVNALMQEVYNEKEKETKNDEDSGEPKWTRKTSEENILPPEVRKQKKRQRKNNK
jgi:hypothetical protein